MEAMNERTIDKLFFIDAETDGLYGPFLSAAVIITDMNCNVIERAYYGVNVKNLSIIEAWTKDNVIPVLGQYTECENECELLEQIWKLWESMNGKAYAVGDVIYPVEVRLFQKCIEKNLTERCAQGPFPFLDISSMKYCKEIDPIAYIEDERFVHLNADTVINNKSQSVHNALYDVEVMIAEYKLLKGELK